MLSLLMDLEISAKTINETTAKIGNELQQVRDEQADDFRARPLTTPVTQAEPPLSLACVEIDGGRMQTRTPSRGPGVHAPHWRENKNAGFFRMTGDVHAEDPCPDLPPCFTDRKQMQDLLTGLNFDEEAAAVNQEKPDLSWRPNSSFRTCISSLCDSERFGELMAAEADRRGFYSALRQSFLGDGLPYNWAIHAKHFSTFTPILDFIHPIERLHETSRALFDDDEQAWQECTKWMTLCWAGDVEEVIGLLEANQKVLGLPDDDTPAGDVRHVLAETITYLRNNVSRMNYPAYRQAGLPITSCLIESQVKEMNKRVKGTEKFWNDGREGEAILQVKASLIGDDDRLSTHVRNRPGSPFARPSRKTRQTAQT